MSESANGKVKFTRGRQQEILAYFYEHPNSDVTIDRLVKVFGKRYDRTKLMATMANLTNVDMQTKYAYPIEKVTSHVWRLKSRPTPGVQDTSVPPHPLDQPSPYVGPEMKQHFEELTVTIIKEQDGEMVVVDDNTNIYRMVKVG